MLLQVVTELLFLLTQLDELLITKICVTDRPVCAHCTTGHSRGTANFLAISSWICRSGSFIKGCSCGCAGARMKLRCRNYRPSKVLIDHTTICISISSNCCGVKSCVTSRRLNFELLILVLWTDKVHSDGLNSGFNIIALVGAMIHRILGQVVDAWSNLLHDKSIDLVNAERLFIPLLKRISTIRRHLTATGQFFLHQQILIRTEMIISCDRLTERVVERCWLLCHLCCHLHLLDGLGLRLLLGHYDIWHCGLNSLLLIHWSALEWQAFFVFLLISGPAAIARVDRDTVLTRGRCIPLIIMLIAVQTCQFFVIVAIILIIDRWDRFSAIDSAVRGPASRFSGLLPVNAE